MQPCRSRSLDCRRRRRWHVALLCSLRIGRLVVVRSRHTSSRIRCSSSMRLLMVRRWLGHGRVRIRLCARSQQTRVRRCTRNGGIWRVRSRRRIQDVVGVAVSGHVIQYDACWNAESGLS